MSYFRHIIDRTLGSAPRSVKPAVTPESIPESFAMEARSAPASRTRKNVWPEKVARNPSVPTDVGGGDSGKDSLPADGAKAASPGAPERLSERTVEVLPVVTKAAGSPKPEYPLGRAGVASDLPITEESTRPVSSQKQEGPSPRAAEKISTAEATSELVAAAEIRAEVPKLALAEQPAVSETTVNTQEPETSVKPLHAINETPTKQVLDKPAESFTEEKTYEIQSSLDPRPTSEPEPEPVQAPARRIDVPAPSTKTDHDGQQKYPLLAPAVPGRTKYPAPALQHEETAVTINIGRIEVKAESPAEPVRVARRRFSPSLSLADYLKQRSEGKRG